MEMTNPLDTGCVKTIYEARDDPLPERPIVQVLNIKPIKQKAPKAGAPQGPRLR